MAKPLSYSVAPGDVGDSRILSGGALVGMVALVVAGLVLVFPKSDLMTMLHADDTSENRDLTVAYLRNIIRTEPNDLELRLRLADKLLAQNDFKGSRSVLDDAVLLAAISPAAQSSWDSQDLSWWQARLQQAQINNQPEEAAQAVVELFARLKRRAASVDTPAQVFAAIQGAHTLRDAINTTGTQAGSVKSQAAQIVHDLLQRLLGMPSAGVADLSRGATLALANASYQQAADLYFAARKRFTPVNTPEHKPAQDKLLRQGVLALMASGQPLLAWQAAELQTQPLPAGDPLHWWLAELALGAARPLNAAIHMRSVVNVNSPAVELAKTLTPQRLELAWDTFAASGDLKAALAVADAGLAARPRSAHWLERKAKVAEWVGLSPLALAAWLELLKQNASTHALANVFRLSPMLYDDDALLAAWLALARQRLLSEVEISKVVDLYERLGSVDGALDFLRQLPAAQPGADATARIRLQSLQAHLLERAGRPAQAIALLEALMPAGLSQENAVVLAQIRLRMGEMQLALRALQSVKVQPDALDTEYWILLADIAFEANERTLALTALDQLVASGKLKVYQAERVIRLRLDANNTTQALALAAQLYRSFPEDIIALSWLDAVSQQNSASSLREMMGALQPNHRRRLEVLPTFLQRRASLYARFGETRLALKDYRESLSLNADDTSTRIAYLWLMVDQQNANQLRAELAQLGSGTRRDPAYAEVMAAAWQMLNEPRLALAFMQPLARAHANDFLWLMNYADVLERSGSEAPALRVRRHAWQLAQRATARPADRDQARQALMVQVRLTASYADGEQKSRLWRALGSMLSAPGEEPALKRQAQELVGAWLLAEGRFDTPQRWLWQQHAARMAVPAYQELAALVAQNNLPELARMLEQADRKTDSGAGNSTNNAISVQDRQGALRLLGRRDEAVTLGMEQALRSPQGLTDDAQQALRDDLLATASRASVQASARQAGVLTRLATTFDASVALSPRLKLTVELNEGRYRSTDTTQIAQTPGRDRELRAGIATHTPWGELKAQALVRSALATVSGLYLQLSTRLNSRSVLQLEVARAERSDESSAMSVAGVRDRAAASLSLRASEHIDAQVSLGKNHFRTQTGAALGSSVDAALAGNWTFRRDYPDIRLQTQLRRSVVRADGQPDAATALLQPGGGVPRVGLFLGPSSTALSATLGVGLAQTDPALYSRAWRPWAEVGFETRQSSLGRQTQGLLRLGTKGSVMGRDQLSVNLDIRPGMGGLSGNEGTRELQLHYEIFFDR